MAYEKREFQFPNTAAAEAKLGKEQVHKIFEHGLADLIYRKGRNLRENFIKERMKDTPEYKRLREQAKKEVDAKLAKGLTK